ncbi:MAG: NAD(P)/FAD-dependent oxidoreductase [Thalassospira sp.]|uniref:NAD(P)/FAD-dependent oxidoreductase n=1 Tax=Thalassospira sp. TaxID=1912094 RepID=UPI003A85FC47
MAQFVVIGAGQAGCSVVARLRKEGFSGNITLIGNESVPPYQRPPLSKGYLLGEMSKEQLFLKPESFYRENDIALRLDQAAIHIDPVSKIVSLGNGEELAYDALALTTGSYPRKLPSSVGGDLKGVFTVRDLSDVDLMSPYFEAGRKVLVIGGGYIGLEAAAVAAKRGLSVTLIEMADRILQRVACSETADYFRNLHQDNGVDIKEGVGLAYLEGEDHVQRALLTNGSELEIDFAIVGVGIQPATELAETAGLKVEDGIVTDKQARTTNPHIWAAGDCATCQHNGELIRIESVGNAIDQSEVAACSMIGRDVVYKPQPWFWSDQYDCKLQIAGLNRGYTDVVIRDGKGFRSHWYYVGNDLIAVDSMNDVRGYMVGKRLIEAGKTAPKCLVSDPNADLKPLLRA